MERTSTGQFATGKITDTGGNWSVDDDHGYCCAAEEPEYDDHSYIDDSETDTASDSVSDHDEDTDTANSDYMEEEGDNASKASEDDEPDDMYNTIAIEGRRVVELTVLAQGLDRHKSFFMYNS